MMSYDLSDGIRPFLMTPPEFLALKHKSRILGHSSNPVCGFFMIEQVSLCAVWPMENWLGSSLNHIQGWTTVRESYSRALEQGPLDTTAGRKFLSPLNHLELRLHTRAAGMAAAWDEGPKRDGIGKAMLNRAPREKVAWRPKRTMRKMLNFQRISCEKRKRSCNLQNSNYAGFDSRPPYKTRNKF